MHAPGIWSYLRKLKRLLRMNKLSPGLRRVIVGIVGIVVLIIGVAMMILPGPAFIMIPLGLAILGTEFYWARCWLRKFGRLLKEARARLRRRKFRSEF